MLHSGILLHTMVAEEQLHGSALQALNLLQQADQLPRADDPVVFFISGNWYDSYKAQRLLDFLRTYTAVACIILAGGIGRFSSPLARSLGGEALEMLQILESLAANQQQGAPGAAAAAAVEEENGGAITGSVHAPGISNSPAVSSSHQQTQASAQAAQTQEGMTSHTSYSWAPEGVEVQTYLQGAHTGGNVDYLMSQLEGLVAKTGASSSRLLHIIAIDESYLVRRVRATILGRLQQAPEAVQAVVRLHAVHAGQRSFRDLVAMHRGSAQAVIHLLWGELDRLFSYSAPSMALFSKQHAFHNLEHMQEDHRHHSIVNIPGSLNQSSGISQAGQGTGGAGEAAAGAGAGGAVAAGAGAGAKGGSPAGPVSWEHRARALWEALGSGHDVEAAKQQMAQEGAPAFMPQRAHEVSLV